MPEIIIGIDPGYADAGYGVISAGGGREKCLAYGSIRTPAGAPAGDRLKTLYGRLKEIIVRFKPRRAAIEKLYFSTNVKTALSVAEARGVILLCLEDLGVPCREFGPGEVKVAVSGHGGAAKSQVQKMTKTLLGLKEIPKPDDAADALALALTLANTRKFDKL